MSDINEYLNHVKEEIETSSSDSRSQAINNGMLNLRKKIRDVEVQTEEVVEPEVEQPKQDYDKLSLADSAVSVYREKLQEKKADVEIPCTKGGRVNTKARIQSMTGLHSGNSGKTSPVPMDNPAKSGNTKGFDSGNVVIAPLSMEEYKEQVFSSFGLDEELKCWKGYKRKKGAVPGTPGSCVKEEVNVVDELEEVLLELDDTSWQSIDKAMRELCREHNITPKELHKQFKSEHGMIPDDWIKEQEVTEDCGWFPLDEMTRINKVGQVYDVTFIFRGGTSRFKFFWPSANRPSKGDMQAAVEKFYPKARLITYYPCPRDNNDNYMVVVPPMTENYEITTEDTWAELPEELNEIYSQICEEVGEPTSVPMLTEEGEIVMWVEDHDTGEELEVVFEANKSGDSSLRDWFSKSKSSDGTPGWVQLGGKYAGKPCARQEGQKTKPKCGSSKMKRNLDKDEEQAAFRRKNREDGNPDRRGKAKNVATEEYVSEKFKYPDKKMTGKIEKQLDNVHKKSKAGVDERNRRVRGMDRELDFMKYDTDTYMKMARDQKARNVAKGKEKRNEEFVAEDMKGMSQKSGDKRSTDSGAGMTAKGVAKYNRRTGGDLKTAVTTPPSKLKPGSKAAGRRKSFCARSRGWTGERGKAARRRWNC